MTKTFEQLMEQVEAGGHPLAVCEAASGPLGADRYDMGSEQEKMAAFKAEVGEIASYNGEIGPDWTSAVAADLAAHPEKAAEHLALAEGNRDRYLRLGYNVTDRGGNAELWTKISRAIIATRTDQIPSHPLSGA